MTAVTFVSNGSETVTVENSNSITARGGAGTDLRGAAVGISSVDALFGSGMQSDGIVRVTGTIIADGEGTDNDLTGAQSESTGVIVNHSGTSTLQVDGGTVTATGNHTHGLSTSSVSANITLENGAQVSTVGTDAHGILITPNTAFFSSDGSQFRAATTSIRIDDGSTLTSTGGTGIFDNGNTTERVDDGTGNFVSQLREADNATTVDLAGAIAGGSGMAIDLGNGEDALILRSTGDVTGNVTLGSGDDMFSFEEGFTTTGRISGGDGNDIIDATVDPNTIRVLDFQALPVDDFETIAKTGAGTLNIQGPGISGPALLQADGGLSQVLSDQIDLNIEVNSGAIVSTDNRVGDVTTLGTGRFQGTGTTASVNNNGVLAPGNSIGAIDVTGDLALNAGGTFDVEIMSDNTSDLINVAGDVFLGGNLQVTALGALTGFSTANQFTIIDAAGGIPGSFSNVDGTGLLDSTAENLPDLNIQANVVPDSDGGEELQLNLVAIGATPPVDPPVEPPVMPPVEPPVTPPVQPPIEPPVLPPVAPLSDVSDKSIHPNAVLAGADVGRDFTDIMQRRTRIGGASGAQVASFAFDLSGSVVAVGQNTEAALNTNGNARHVEGFSIWTSGISAFRDVDNSGAITGFDATTGGFLIGVDRTFVSATATYQFGVSSGYSVTDVDSGPSSADVDTFHIGAYARIEAGALLASAAFAYGSQDYEFDRVIQLGGGATAVASGDADGDVFSFSAAASYDIAPMLGIDRGGKFRFAPLVRFDHADVSRDAFTETGAGILNLTTAEDNFNRTWGSIGLEMSGTVETSAGMVVNPFLEFRYERALNDPVNSTSSAIAGVAGANFTALSASPDRNSFAVGTGISAKLTDMIEANVRYDGTFSGNFETHRASGGITIRF